MMNYYEMLRLPCDGRQADDTRIIQSALTQWEISKKEALDYETQENKRRILRLELEELPNMQKLLKDASFRKKQADELKTKRIRQLECVIGILTNNINAEKTVSKARIGRYAGLLGLLSHTVEGIFIAGGFTVTEPQLIKTTDFLMEKRVLDKITGDFELIRNYMQGTPHEPLREIGSATNLYEYIAVMDGKSVRDADEYEIMPTDKLAKLFSIKMMEHVKTAAPEIWYKDIESQAKVFILRDDQQRTKYDNALKMQKYESIFEIIGELPAHVKLEPDFAEAYIRIIQKIFPDEKQAIAVYNKYAQLPLDALYSRHP